MVRIASHDVDDIGQEFFRWEIATAVAGAVLGINPFDQPDVEASKIATRKLTSRVRGDRGAARRDAVLRGATASSSSPTPRNAAALEQRAGRDAHRSSLSCGRISTRLGAGDYFAILAYVEMNAAHDATLQALRHAVRDRTRVATCLGFGPRFLHSTGQAYKGGPNSGVFLQITCDDARDLPVPGQKYTFGVVKAAQARGDSQVLAERGRRALRVHLGPTSDRAWRRCIAARREAIGTAALNGSAPARRRSRGSGETAYADSG